MGTGLVRVSYLHTVGEARAVAWEISARSTGSVEVSSTGGSHVRRLGEEDLAQC